MSLPSDREIVNDTTFRIKRHYRNVGLERGWPFARWQSFCRHFKGFTEREVAALLNIEERELWAPEGPRNQGSWLYPKSLFRQGRRVRLPTSLSTYLTWVESAILEHHGLASKPFLPFELIHLNQTPT